MYEHNALGYQSGLALCLTKVRSSRARCPATALILFYFYYSVLRPSQDYFNSYETAVGGRKRENPKKNHPAHPQAELGLSHMWPVRGSNPHQTQR